MAAPLSIHPDALAAVAALVSREWGQEGYRFTDFSTFGDGSVLAEVTASDGSRFFVASTRYANTVHDQDEVGCYQQLRDRMVQERMIRSDGGSAAVQYALVLVLAGAIAVVMAAFVGGVLNRFGDIDRLPAGRGVTITQMGAR
jgi:Flp pilus assembly pilin Flp